jgi:hypothetical protein
MLGSIGVDTIKNRLIKWGGFLLDIIGQDYFFNTSAIFLPISAGLLTT